MKKLLIFGWVLFLLAGCQKPAVINWVLAEEGVYTLSDGTRVDLWQQDQFQFWQVYKLSDGTELLRENRSSGPENVHVGSQITFESLNETAQENISAYYQERGLLYDIPTELEKAYQAYLHCQETGEEFSSFLVEQSIVPCGSNDEICCYMTVVTSSYDVQLVNEQRLGEVFRRDPGEKVYNGDLFVIPLAAAPQWFADYYGKEEPLNSEMRAAFRPEYVVLWNDHLEVMFPAGTLPSQEHSTGMSIEYADLKGVLLEWAVPTQSTD